MSPIAIVLLIGGLAGLAANYTKVPKGSGYRTVGAIVCAALIVGGVLGAVGLF